MDTYLNDTMNKTYFNRYKISCLIAVALICVISKCECANILAVFPTPFISHHLAFRPFVNELVKRGHRVTVITTDPEYPKGETPQNLTEVDLHDLSYAIWNKFMKIDKDNITDSHSVIQRLLETYNDIFEEQMKSSEVQELIHRKETYDLLIVESCIRIAIGLSHIIKAPMISLSSFGPFYQTLESTGAVTNLLAYPLVLRQRILNLTLWEKFSEIYTHYKADHSYVKLEEEEHTILKRVFDPNIPDMRELRKNIDMTFLNVHRLWDFNRPVPPNVLYLGGLQLLPQKSLPNDLKSFLDASKNGAIYMSFGTNIKPSLLPREKIQIFFRIFSQLPYNILWKWDSDDVPGHSENIKMFKWCPQSDLLKHPNIKLFITQGGLQSTDDAIIAGVPLIGMPMFSDQWYNSEMYMKHNIGLQLDITSITEDIFRNAVETIIKNPVYHENVIKLRNKMHDQPLTSLERAVWWTEHVLRHGNADHLRTPAAHMHWTEYYALDLVLIFISVVIVVSILSIYCIYFMVSYLYNNILIFKRIKTKKT